MKRELLLALALINISYLASCDTNTVNTSQDTNIVYLDKGIHSFKVSDKKGISLSFNINKSDYFNTKATTNGTSLKSINDIKSYKVYLIKNSASTYPLDGDPLSDVVAGSESNFNTNGSEYSIVSFTNVQSSGSDYYYIAVRAYDDLNATGNEIIKPNNGRIGTGNLWTGTTATTNQMAVSSGAGLNVNSSGVITPTNTLLNVNPKLIDATGSFVDVQITISVGDYNDVNSYKFNLCTDPTDPEYTRVLSESDSLIVNRTPAQYTSGGNKHTITLSNIPTGTYYVTTEAYRGLDATGTNNTAVISPSTGAKIAVSTNAVTISSTQNVSFTPNTLNYSDISLNLGQTKFNPSVAMNASGSFIIAWESQDESGKGIYAQRYDSAGVAQGSEFKVNTYTTGNQINPSVGINTAGDFIVSWSGEGDLDTDGIYTQRYSSAGVASGSETKVNTYTTNNQSNPSIAVNASGAFVVAWESTSQDGNGNGVYAQRYTSAGVASGSEFQVNTYTTGNQSNPSVKNASNGNFIIAWDGQGTTDTSGVYYKRYNSSGAVTIPETRVNTYTTDTQQYPSAAMDTAGAFVIGWQSNLQDGDGFGVYAQRYNSAAVKQGSEVIANTITSNNQSFPSITMNDTLGFVISWQSDTQDGDGLGIYAQRYNTSGTKQGSEFQVNTYTTGNQTNPSVGIGTSSTSDFVVIWQSDTQDTTGNGVYTQRYNSSGVAQ